jgi:hypothetical protein
LSLIGLRQVANKPVMLPKQRCHSHRALVGGRSVPAPTLLPQGWILQRIHDCLGVFPIFCFHAGLGVHLNTEVEVTYPK